MILKGPFIIKWGDNTIEDIQELEVNQETETETHETVRGKVFEIDKGTSVSVVLTLLASDVPALAAVVPQHYVAENDELSTGELVTESVGAIDFVPHRCDNETVYNPLDIISCGENSYTMRIVNARSKIDGVEIDNKVEKIKIKFVGQAPKAQAVMQWFKNGMLDVDYLLLENGELFLLENGENLIL